MTVRTETIRIGDVRALALNACAAVGASPAAAMSLVDATLSAMRCGQPELGFPHFLQYLRAFREGRIDGKAVPSIERPLPAMVFADAKGGIAQLGFDLAYGDFADATRALGICLFTQKNSHTTGELGYYVRRLAKDGLIGIAATNGPALMAARAGGKPVYCTNPVAFGAPADPPGNAVIIDQASSATAFYNIVRAASEDRPIPEGWATDEDGTATTDPHKALHGGALLPFGGYKGANIALMVEILSAGLSGSAWSLDAGALRAGGQSAVAALTVIALSPAAIDPGFAGRLTAHLARLRDHGVHIPGARVGEDDSGDDEFVTLDSSVLDEMRGFAKP